MHNFRDYLAVLPPLYGVARKLPMLCDGEISKYNYNKGVYEPRPMLVTEKLSAICLCTILSYGFVPFWAYNDINMMEIRLKNLDPNDFGYNKKSNNFIDYLMN